MSKTSKTISNQDAINEIDLNIAKELIDELKTSLFYFDKMILNYNDLAENVHLELCEFIDERYIEPNENVIKPFKLMLLPRGSFKSSAVTVGFVVYSIINNPDIRILIANEKLDNAKRFLSEIKGHFEANQKITNYYGNYVSKFGWREDSIVVSQRTKNLKEPTVSCAGVEVVKVGMHYDLIIMDDLVSDLNTGTREQMDKVKDFYRLALSLLEPNGKIIVIGTRWHYDDLYAHLMENESHRFNKYIRGAYNPDGSLWFPQRLTKEFLDDQRLSQRGYIFACQYLNNPIDDEEAIFKKSWIKYFSLRTDGTLVPQEEQETHLDKAKKTKYKINECNVFIHIDPATSEQKWSDYTGIVVTAVDPEENVYVLEAERKKIILPDLIKHIFKLYDKYSPNVRKILIEEQATLSIIKYPLFEEQKKRGKFLPIHEITHMWKIKKEDRIASMQQRFQFGTIFINVNTPDIEDELLRFPKGQHDDIIDALSFGIPFWKKSRLMKVSQLPANCFKAIMDKKKNKGKDNFKSFMEKQPIGVWRI